MVSSNDLKNAGIGAGAGLGGSMILGPVAGPIAGGYAADRLSGKDSASVYTKAGMAIGAFTLLSNTFGGGGGGRSSGGVM